MALNSIAEGSSTITETIFENRFMHVPELSRMGANLKLEGNTVVCKGVKSLSGANLMALQFRAGITPKFSRCIRDAVDGLQDPQNIPALPAESHTQLRR